MSAIVTEARAWKGVEYLHQGRTRAGIDCAGLPWAVYTALGVAVEDFRAYGEEADPAELLRRLRAALGAEVATAPVNESDLQPGDVVLFQFRIESAPRHLGIVADCPYGGFSYIDADGFAGKVTERRLSDKYRARITHVFRRPV